MILSAQTIRERCSRGELISPFHERTKHGGLTFGLSSSGYDIRIAQDFMLSPGSFQLASSIEKFTMPSDVLGIVHDKSTWARLGLAVQNTVIEPGWMGYLTLELTNHWSHYLDFKYGTPIAQIIFHLLDQPTETKYSGKYQDQAKHPQGAIFE